MIQFYCSKCGDKVSSEFLKPGEIYFHKKCSGETKVPESKGLKGAEEIRARYEKFTADKIVEKINLGMQTDEFEVAREVLAKKLADAPKVVANQNDEQSEREIVPKTINTKARNVVVTDIQMTFGSIFVFSIKWMLASIPAIIIIYGCFFLLGLAIGSW